MEEFKIKGSLEFDTSKAQENLNSFIQDANYPLMAGNNEIPTLAQGENNNGNGFNEVFTSLEDSFKGVLNSIKSLSSEINKLDLINVNSVKEAKPENTPKIEPIDVIIDNPQQAADYITNGKDNNKPDSNNNMQPETVENTTEKFESLSDVTTKLKDTFKDVLGNLKDFSQQLDNRNLPATREAKDSKSLSLGDKSELQSWQKGVMNLPTLVNSGANVVGNLANENIAGAAISGVNSVGQAGMKLGGNLMNNGVGGLGKNLLIGSGAALVIGGLLKGANSLASEYEDALPELDKLNQTFGGDEINGNSSVQNAKNSLELRRKASLAAEGTGMTNEEFVNLSSSLGQYGITNQDRANDIVKQAANWNRYTGADASQVANFAGLMERYGGNGTQMVQTAYGAARASGLDKSQFGEFLTGLQSVVENGISKGFVRSADDVAESLTNVSLLSGNNPLWSGKQGADRYNQMSSAMSNATALNTTSSQLIYQAMANTMVGKDGKEADWIDVMSKIEQGDWGNSKFLENYKKVLNGMYGNDKNSQIASIKDSFGLNWTGAQDVYKMIFDNTDNNGKKLTPEEIDAKIKSYQTDPRTASDATTMQDALNRLNQSITELGRKPSEEKYELISDISQDVKTIAEKLNIKIDDKEGKKEAHNAAKVNDINYNNIYGKAYTYTTTDPKNDNKTETHFTTDEDEANFKSGGAYSGYQLSLSKLYDEANYKYEGKLVTTPEEQAAYAVAQGLAESGVDPEIFKQFMNEIAKADRGKTAKEGHYFDKGIIDYAVNQFKQYLTVKVTLPEGY